MSPERKKIAIVAGGDSSEYDISIGSATNILGAIDTDAYEAIIVDIKNSGWQAWGPEGTKFDINKHDFSTQLNGSKFSFDAVVNAIHGTPGENGKLQAYFDLIGMPYTGCDFFCSSLTFNKYACNNYFAQSKIHVAPSIPYRSGQKPDLNRIQEVIAYPCFIKPNNGGSSCGTSRVENPGEADIAIEKAFREDDEVLVEKFLPGREVTCGMVITSRETHVFPLTEIITRKKFFDYEAKYTPGVADEITPANLPEKTARSIKDLSILIADLLHCRGLIRIDYILDKDQP